MEEEAAKYYANILTPFSRIADKAIGRLLDSGLELRLIAPDHGPIWRRRPQWIIERYQQWLQQPYTRRAVVLYDTMWGSTERMAAAIGDGLTAHKLHVDLMPLGSNHRSDVATRVLEAGALVVGTPTMNGQLFPSVADCMTYLRGLQPKNLIGAAFGSYGWAPKAVKDLEGILDDMKIERIGDSITANYRPDDDELQACHDLGLAVGERLAALTAATAQGETT
jgi:flavorubredoxin